MLDHDPYRLWCMESMARTRVDRATSSCVGNHFAVTEQLAYKFNVWSFATA